MFATLCVSEVGSIVLMYCEAETAFERADMVLEEVRVFVEVDGFEREFSQTFTTVGICGRVGGYSPSSEFATCTVLWGVL